MLDAMQWFSSAEETIPTSSWDARAFVPEMTGTALAILWDWLGSTFQPYLTRALMRAIWKKSMSTCQGDLMEFEYMRTMNQGAIFCRPLVLGGLMLEDAWNMGTYVDDWYAAMMEVVKKVMMQGGGAQEGPIYLAQFAHGVLWAIVAWNRARGKSWQKQVKSVFSDVPSYLQSISQNTPNTCTPLGDSRSDTIGGDLLPVLAGLGKDRFLHASAKQCVASGAAFRASGTLTNSGGILSLVYGSEEIGGKVKGKVSPFIVNKKSQKVRFASELKGQSVSVLLNGRNSGASHSHEDAGSIIVNIGDMPVLCDPGMVSYESIETNRLKTAVCHNVLIPLDDSGQCVSSQKLGSGKGVVGRIKKEPFSAYVNLDGVWEELPEYTRAFTVVKSNTIAINDFAVGAKPGIYAFSLVTPCSAAVDENTLVVDLGFGEVRIGGEWVREVVLTKGLKDWKGNEITCAQLRSDRLVDVNIATNVCIDL